MSPLRMSALACCLALACLALCPWAGALRIGLKPGSAVFLRRFSELNWKPHPRLPGPVRHHRIRKDPRTGAVQELLRLPPKYSAAEHSHDDALTLVVVRGKLRVRTGGREEVLKAGEFAALPPGTPHTIESLTWTRDTWVLATAGSPPE